MMQLPELTMEERLEQLQDAIRDLERVLEAFAVRFEKRFDEIDKNLRMIINDALVNNQRISIVEARLDEPSERPTLPPDDSSR